MGPPTVRGRGSVCRPQEARPGAPPGVEQAPGPLGLAKMLLPHPSLVLTAGIGLPGAPPPQSVTLVLAPGLKGSDVPPAAGEEQTGTVDSAQTQLWKRGKQGQRSAHGWHRALGKW